MTPLVENTMLEVIFTHHGYYLVCQRILMYLCFQDIENIVSMIMPKEICGVDAFLWLKKCKWNGMPKETFDLWLSYLKLIKSKGDTSFMCKVDKLLKSMTFLFCWFEL